MTRSHAHNLWLWTFAMILGAAVLGCGLFEDLEEEEEDTGPRCSFWTSDYKRIASGKIRVKLEVMDEIGDMTTPIPEDVEWLVGVDQGSGTSINVKGCVRQRVEPEESLPDEENSDEGNVDGEADGNSDADGEGTDEENMDVGVELEEQYWSEWEVESVWQFRGPVYSTTKLWAGKPVPGAASVTLNVFQNEFTGTTCTPEECPTQRILRANFSESGVSRAEVETYDVGVLDARGWVLDNDEMDRLDFDFDIAW